VDYNLINTLDIDEKAIENELAQAFEGETDPCRIGEAMEKTVGSFAPGSILKGRIVNLIGDDVIVDVGLKSEGIIPASEWDDPSSLDIGDEVEVLLEAVESETGIVVLSKRKAPSAC